MTWIAQVGGPEKNRVTGPRMVTDLASRMAGSGTQSAPASAWPWHTPQPHFPVGRVGITV